jgi:hypothetical protein
MVKTHTAKKVLAAQFNQGGAPTIVCINQATVPLGVNFDKLVAALQKAVDNDFKPIWGTDCKLITGDAIGKDEWAIVFTNDADAANALGYHDLTPAGLPLSKVFVRTTIADGGLVSVTASHELFEMLVDPGIQMAAQNPNDNIFYAYETADAVEEETYNVNGIPISNFVYPAWFESFHKPGAAKFDHLNSCTRPFELRPGGYIGVFHNGRWSQIFGSKSAAEKWKRMAHSRQTGRVVGTRMCSCHRLQS